MTHGLLYVCAVPIGNLEDASPRLRHILASVDIIACEDTRTTRRLLDLLGLRTDARLLAHHAHNESASSSGIVQLLLAGSDVALVSDAGSPGVSDPGSVLVAAAHEAGVEVVAVPGPSAVAAALGVAGARGSAGDGGYRFVGFLPRAEGALRELLELRRDDLVVAFEAPTRVARSLDVVASLQPERGVIVCRELTKRHEQVLRGTARSVVEQLDGEVRGELVVLLEPCTDAVATDEGAAVALARSMHAAGLGARDAARIAADHLGGVSRRIYAALHDS